MMHGVLMRVAEEEFYTSFLGPYTACKLATGNHRAKGEFVWDVFVWMSTHHNSGRKSHIWRWSQCILHRQADGTRSTPTRS